MSRKDHPQPQQLSKRRGASFFRRDADGNLVATPTNHTNDTNNAKNTENSAVAASKPTPKP